MVLELTNSENIFLKRHSILPDHIYDARKLRSSFWKADAKKKGRSFVLGSPCKAAGHRLRTRAGHCIQCDPKKIAFFRRYRSGGLVYIAGSLIGGIFKVGTAGDREGRQQSLQKESYGGYDDWIIIATAWVGNSGEVEFNIHRQLEIFFVTGQYLKDGRIQDARELIKAPLPTLLRVFEECTSTADKEKLWKYQKFSKYDFARI